MGQGIHKIEICLHGDSRHSGSTSAASHPANATARKGQMAVNTCHQVHFVSNSNITCCIQPVRRKYCKSRGSFEKLLEVSDGKVGV